MIGGEVYSTEKGKCNGIEVYLNPKPDDGKTTSCTKEDYNSNSGTDKKEGCMKWYVYDVSDNGYTMILDHSTTETGVAWASKADYDATNGKATELGITYFGTDPTGDYGTNGNNNKGPLTVLKKLKEDTNDWNAIPERTDTYTAATDTNGNGYTINYSGYKSKLISAEEVAAIVRKSDWDTSQEYFYLDGAYSTSDTNGKWQTQVANASNLSNYAWLYNNLTNCETYGCSKKTNTANAYGYWTSTARVGGSSIAWPVHFYGALNTDYVHGSYRGVRPVITVSKSKIIS